MKPVILGLAGHSLTDDERALFRDADPAGYILFKHNVRDPDQLRALTDSLRVVSGRDDLPILIDQEGGRVARLQPPVWPAFPPSGAPFGDLYARAPMTAIEAARSNAEALALMLRSVGITVNCLPVLDVRRDGMADVIGDRSFGADPLMVASLGRAVLEGLRAGGCVGAIKHMPGQGRATSDSHAVLPVVDARDAELAQDMAPFAVLSDAPIAITAHVIYSAWDKDRCASVSPVVIEDIIRQRIGFDGLLLSDDTAMNALSGTAAERAAAVVNAGCDIALACWARDDDVRAIVDALPDMSRETSTRLDLAMAAIRPAAGDAAARVTALSAKRDALLAVAA